MKNKPVSPIAFAAALCATLMTANARGQSASFVRQSYPLLGNNHVAADFNGDGKLDLAGAGANAASVMLGNGDGTFRAKTDFPLATQSQAVTAGDFNGDGRTDLVLTLNDTQFSLALLTGTGTGTFNAPAYFPNSSGFDSPAVIAADLNNDGNLDLVVMHNIACFTAPCRPASSITVLLGNGNATFQPPREIDVAVAPHAMAVGDFNRDGIKDVAVGGENTELSILLGVGDGTFVRQPIMMLVPGGDLFSACNDVDVADFNRDSIQDLVVPLGNGNGNAILLGNGDGTFRVATRILDDANSAPYNIAVADYNGDGFQDIARAMGDGTRGVMQIVHGNGDGTFQPTVRYFAPAAQSSIGGVFITSSDFNGDGKPDLALEVGGASTALNVMINSTGAATPPATLTISALTLSPITVTGGTASRGTVTLGAKTTAATAVRLSSNNAATSIPGSVTVPAGASSATFTVSTAQVSAATTATITATLNSTSRSATLTINPAAVATDSVSITRAEYDSSKRILRVEASSTKASATLQVYVTSTSQLIGTLSNNGGGKFSGQFTWSTNPQNITVRSNLGGQTSRAVTAK